MRIFADTANLEELKRIYELGIVSGVTTNPVLVKKERTKDLESRMKEICKITYGDVLTQVIGSTRDKMISQAQKIASWSEKMVVKIPATEEGIAAVSQLSKMGIRTCVTVLFTPGQALAAALAGAVYVAPFYERSYAVGHRGIQLIKEIADMYKLHNMKTKVLAASIASAQDIVDAALSGADAATASTETIRNLIRSPFSERTIKEFLEGWDGNEL